MKIRLESERARYSFVAGYVVTGLELLELRVPAHVPLGTRASLYCRWKLGPTDVLYSVKWYKDGKEFFRHVPRDVEPRRKFLLPGVDVEVCVFGFRYHVAVAQGRRLRR